MLQHWGDPAAAASTIVRSPNPNPTPDPDSNPKPPKPNVDANPNPNTNQVRSALNKGSGDNVTAQVITR